jgi:hypothetical protein
MAVVTRRDDRRRAVTDFRETVRTVSAAMIDLVPDAAVVPA